MVADDVTVSPLDEEASSELEVLGEVGDANTIGYEALMADAGVPQLCSSGIDGVGLVRCAA
jgi:hypothetical protein